AEPRPDQSDSAAARCPFEERAGRDAVRTARVHGAAAELNSATPELGVSGGAVKNRSQLMPHTGQCFCGQVKLTIDAEALGARMCWCRDCQRIASGSATVNVLFPEEAVTCSGEIATLRKIADSGNVVERGFCPKCGSQI